MDKKWMFTIAAVALATVIGVSMMNEQQNEQEAGSMLSNLTTTMEDNMSDMANAVENTMDDAMEATQELAADAESMADEAMAKTEPAAGEAEAEEMMNDMKDKMSN